MVKQVGWNAKIARAERHLNELYAFLDVVATSVQCRVHGEPAAGRSATDWVYRAQFDRLELEDVDQTAALIIGDIVHNLRSSLDYIVIALAPTNRRRDARFPFIHARYIERRFDGTTSPPSFPFVDQSDETSKRRRRFLDAIEGIPERAKEQIEMTQPSRAIGGESWLSDLHALDLADKHHNPLTVLCGLNDVDIKITSSRHNVHTTFHGPGIDVRDGMVVLELPRAIPDGSDNAEMSRLRSAFGLGEGNDVTVAVTGSPIFYVQVPDVDRIQQVPQSLAVIVQQVRHVTNMMSWSLPKS